VPLFERLTVVIVCETFASISATSLMTQIESWQQERWGASMTSSCRG
jgi:hypothetical protein